MTFDESPALVFVDSSSEVVSAAIHVIRTNERDNLQSSALRLVRDKFDVEGNVRAFESRMKEVVKSDR